MSRWIPLQSSPLGLEAEILPLFHQFLQNLNTRIYSPLQHIKAFSVLVSSTSIVSAYISVHGMADTLKAEGNKAFAEKKFDEAMCVHQLFLYCYLLTGSSEKFTQAIEIEPQNHVLYSNRSGAYASKKEFDQALEDANKTTEIKPDWAKGWSRKGSALHGTRDLGMSEFSGYRQFKHNVLTVVS